MEQRLFVTGRWPTPVTHRAFMGREFHTTLAGTFYFNTLDSFHALQYVIEGRQLRQGAT